MRDNVINLEASRTTDDITSKSYVNGIREVDGVAGFMRLQLIEIFEGCAEELECDYAELTVADIFEYLVAREEEFQLEQP